MRAQSVVWCLGATVAVLILHACAAPTGGAACNEMDECGEESERLSAQLIQYDLAISQGNPAGMLMAGQDLSAPTTTITTTLPPTGLTVNAEGDLTAFLSALASNVAMVIACFVSFCFLRLRYPVMYSNNVLEGFAPKSPPETFFGWFSPTISVTVEETERSVGLDHALMLEYTHLCMKVLAIIGIPMLFVIGPCNLAFGGRAAGDDHLSYLSFGNVEDGSKLYWVHAFVVWGVVLCVTKTTHNAMKKFLPMRFQWLREMSDLRANTVLVESIPEEFQSEEELQAFFQDIFPGREIKSTYIAKDTTLLLTLIAKRDAARYNLKEAEAKWDKVGRDPEKKPMARVDYTGRTAEAIPHYTEVLAELEPQVKKERGRVLEESKMVGGVNTSSGFVTFADRSAAEILLRLDKCVAEDEDLWELYNAPEPSDILWADLTQDDTAQVVREGIGYLLVLGLAFAYMPLVIGVTNIAKLINFSDYGLDIVQSFWSSLAPTIGLQFMVAFLPTFLILIFKYFFTLRSEAWQQHKLQVWYFWFQVVFVILATAVGTNFTGFVHTLVDEPTSIFITLAESMPNATHFYMNYLVLQWTTHSMNVTRYFPLFKFKAFAQIFEEKDAKLLAEPEDQDYYGMGSRSARWTIMMGIGIVFGTLSPPINLLCFLNFVVCRVVYAYLFCFAETKKSDLGGAFWVTQLKHTFVICVIYCILMIGVLAERASNYGPAIIAAPSIVWVFFSKGKFDNYIWEKLPIQELIRGKPSPYKRPNKGQYVQPELLELLPDSL